MSPSCFPFRYSHQLSLLFCSLELIILYRICTYLSIDIIAKYVHIFFINFVYVHILKYML
nr:MAG TPA: hypothetical protein [Caudoviricetes sp.]